MIIPTQVIAPIGHSVHSALTASNFPYADRLAPFDCNGDPDGCACYAGGVAACGSTAYLRCRPGSARQGQLDGLVVDVPSGWSIASASFLRGPFRALNGEIEALDERRYRILLAEPLVGPAEIVITLEVGASYVADRLEIHPLIRSVVNQSMGIRETVRAVDAAAAPQDRVLSFESEGAEPVAFRREAHLEIDLRRPFLLSFWMKTTSLGEIVLSTWNGDDRSAYPVEIVVDRAGRLRSFRGRPGEHQALSSQRPVADGRWHEVILRNDPEEGWMHLVIDGRSVDSLYAPIAADIRNELPLVLGGRSDGPAPYFDGLTGYSGAIDELLLAAGETDIDDGSLALPFEDPIPPMLLLRPARGVERIPSDRAPVEEIEDFRVQHLPDGIALDWTSSSAEVEAFVVERSRDGQSFEEIARASPAPDGAYRVYDDAADSGVIYYRVRQIFSGGMERVSGTVKVGIGGEEQPHSATVIGNYPNPFNASTTISYEVREPSDVSLGIWDLSGQAVRHLVDRRLMPGTYHARFDAEGLPSGTYFVRLRTPEGIESHKVTLAK